MYFSNFISLLVHLFFGASLFFENKGKGKGGKILNGGEQVTTKVKKHLVWTGVS
jgi:hypothetical protein